MNVPGALPLYERRIRLVRLAWLEERLAGRYPRSSRPGYTPLRMTLPDVGDAIDVSECRACRTIVILADRRRTVLLAPGCEPSPGRFVIYSLVRGHLIVCHPTP